MKRILIKIAFFMLVSLLIASALLLVLALVPEGIMNKTLRDMLFEIDKWLFLTGVLGFGVSFTSSLISQDILAITRENRKLRRVGIKTMHSNTSSQEEVRLMFGDGANNCPIELKFLFISGINFIKYFRNSIIRAIEHGADVKIMIGDPFSEKGREFLEHNQQFRGEINPNGMTDIEECEAVTSLLKDMQKEIADKKLPGSLRLRYYTDQYRCNCRIAIFEDENKKREVRMWSSFQTQTRIAVDLSLAAYGTYNEADESVFLNKAEEEQLSLVVETNNSFDKLWEMCGKDAPLNV